MSAAGRVEPLAVTDDLDAYTQRLVRLGGVKELAGGFLASSMDVERNADSPAFERVAREYAQQAIAIGRELAAWRAANPDAQGRW